MPILLHLTDKQQLNHLKALKICLVPLTFCCRVATIPYCLQRTVAVSSSPAPGRKGNRYAFLDCCICKTQPLVFLRSRKLSVFNIYHPPTSILNHEINLPFLTFLKTFNPLSLMLLLFLMTLSSLVTSIFMLMTSRFSYSAVHVSSQSC
jgi:hypothetical protein